MATYQVIIGGVDVLALGNAHLQSFTRNYDDPAELVIRVPGDWRQSPWPCDTPVYLVRNGAVVFEGLLNLPRPVASPSEFPAVEIPAQDRSIALRFDTALNAETYPDFQLATGSLSAVLTAFVAVGNVAERMAAKGISTEFEFVGGAASIQVLPLSFSNEKIDDCLRKIAASAPGVRCFLAPPANYGEAPKYRFVSLFGAAAHDVTIDVTRVSQLSITPSVDGRGGAVRVLGGETRGEADVETLTDVALMPAWAPLVEGLWSLKDAYERKTDGAPIDDELYKVFRVFNWPQSIELTEDMIESAMAEVVHDELPENQRWKKVAIERIDVEEREVWLKSPAIAQRLVRNAHAYRVPAHRGRSKGLTVKLRTKESGTATTPIYIAEHRYPETGYAGRAYQLAPLRCACELIVPVPSSVDRATYAAQAFAALSEPTITGEIPLDDDLPAELWTLSRRINIRTASHGESGLEDLAAPMMGLNVSFDGVERATIEFNRDDSLMLTEAQS